MNPVDATALSLRQLRAVLSVAETGSISHASAHLARSHSATSKAVSQIEKQLGIRLFDRVTAGMIPTSYGEALVKRLKSANREFERAGAEYRNLPGDPNQRQNPPVFRMEIGNNRLIAFIAVHRFRDIRFAADRLDIAPHAVYRALNELQDQLNLPLFERSTGGTLEATPFSRVLNTHVRLAFSEIQHAVDEMAGMADGIVRGRLAIATLPPVRNLIAPRAISRLLKSHPRIRVATLEGDLHVMESALRSGDLDFVIGVRYLASDHPDLILHPIMDAEARILARAGHPLGRVQSVTAEDLAAAKWILPPMDTPIAEWFRSYFNARGLEPPSDWVESGSSQVVDGVLLESDRLALSSVYDAQRRSELSAIVPLAARDIEQFSRTTVPKVQIIMRANTTMSPAAKLFYEQLIGVVRDIEKTGRTTRQTRERAPERERRIVKRVK